MVGTSIDPSESWSTKRAGWWRATGRGSQDDYAPAPKPALHTTAEKAAAHPVPTVTLQVVRGEASSLHCPVDHPEQSIR